MKCSNKGMKKCARFLQLPRDCRTQDVTEEARIRILLIRGRIETDKITDRGPCRHVSDHVTKNSHDLTPDYLGRLPCPREYGRQDCVGKHAVVCRFVSRCGCDSGIHESANTIRGVCRENTILLVMLDEEQKVVEDWFPLCNGKRSLPGL